MATHDDGDVNSGQTPETGITPGGTTGAFRDMLAKGHARRGKPPVHLVDMSPEERVAAAKEKDAKRRANAMLDPLADT